VQAKVFTFFRFDGEHPASAPMPRPTAKVIATERSEIAFNRCAVSSTRSSRRNDRVLPFDAPLSSRLPLREKPAPLAASLCSKPTTRSLLEPLFQASRSFVLRHKFSLLSLS